MAPAAETTFEDLAEMLELSVKRNGIAVRSGFYH